MQDLVTLRRLIWRGARAGTRGYRSRAGRRWGWPPAAGRRSAAAGSTRPALHRETGWRVTHTTPESARTGSPSSLKRHTERRGHRLSVTWLQLPHSSGLVSLQKKLKLTPTVRTHSHELAEYDRLSTLNTWELIKLKTCLCDTWGHLHLAASDVQRPLETHSDISFVSVFTHQGHQPLRWRSVGRVSQQVVFMTWDKSQNSTKTGLNAGLTHWLCPTDQHMLAVVQLFRVDGDVHTNTVKTQVWTRFSVCPAYCGVLFFPPLINSWQIKIISSCSDRKEKTFAVFSAWSQDVSGFTSSERFHLSSVHKELWSFRLLLQLKFSSVVELV